MALVADHAVLEAGVLDPLVARLQPDAIHRLPQGEPRVETVGPIAASLSRRDVVVAVGGGSTLDTAKLAAAVATSPHDLEDHLLAAERFTASLPVVAVPTTAGSGAEVTRTAVVSKDGRKSWAWDDHLRPVAAVHDPALTLTMPPATTVASGVDAFVHAVEAATAQQRNPTHEAPSAWAAGAIARALPAVVADPDSIEGRTTMLLAACTAGAGIDRCGVGAGHAIGHALGSVVRVTHGFAVMLGTLIAISWNVAGSGDRYSGVARALHVDATAADVPDLVRRLAADVDLDAHLGVQAEQQPLDAGALALELARPEHATMLRNNAVVPTADDLAWLAADTAAAWNAAGGHM